MTLAQTITRCEVLDLVLTSLINAPRQDALQ